MKRVFKRLSLFLAGLAVMATAAAQMSMPMPVDKAVRVGKLPNGLTYYIRHNELPKGQADFYIAQRVGSVLEEDNQRGLAHFLEHMCFNGTKSFPGNEMINWLEKVGVKFGQNLNAYTSIDETIYNISNVPVARIGVQDTCLLILHDWADGLLLDPEEIEKERGVIHQEWRRTNVGQMRIMEKLLPTIYPDNRYGYRMPIGTMDVVDNFPPKDLRDYYETWYRPDQQGIVVVGDIDVDRIEGKIKELFSPIEMPANAKERVYYPVADNPGTIYAIGADKEMTFPLAMLMFKTDATPDSLRSSIGAVAQDYVTTMIDQMLNNRLNDIVTKPDAPFAQAVVEYGEFLISKTKDALTMTVLAKGDDIIPATTAAYRELLRASRGGFTASEYDRARDEYLSRLESRYNDRDNTPTQYFVNKYIKNFTDNEPMPSIEDQYSLMQMLAKQVTVTVINMAMKELVGTDNRVVAVFSPEKEGYTIPTEQQIAEAMNAIDAEEIAPYVDEVKSEPLIASLPKPGKITKTANDKQWGTERWTLSNGATVVVKKTGFKNDEILFRAVAKGGGTSTIDDSKANSVIFFPYAMSQTGLGSYSFSDMQKYLQGKQVNCEFSIDDYIRELEGSATPKDLTTLMELIYMTMTDIQISDDEFESMRNTMGSIMKNQAVNPQYIFTQKIANTLVKSPKGQAISIEAIEGAKREDVLSIAHNATANAADYTFFFVGNVDTDSLRPLVERYIASLPGNAKKAEKTIIPDASMEIAAGTSTNTFTTAMETPQTWVAIFASGNVPYTDKNKRSASAAGQILTKRLLDTVREREGAVYSISAAGNLNRAGLYPATIQTAFPMKPEMKDKVLGMIRQEFTDMCSNVTDEELDKVKEFMVKTITENREQNQSWVSAMQSAAINGVDTFNNAMETVNSLTTADVMNFMKEVLSQGNYQVIVLDPAEETEETEE